MGTFDNLKKKALAAAETIVDASADLYKKAEVKTKELARTAKLQADIASYRTSIKKLYMQIGKTYYETHKMFPAEEFEQSCTEITSLFEQIAEREAEIEDIKTKSGEAADDEAADDITDVDDLEDLETESAEEKTDDQE